MAIEYLKQTTSGMIYIKTPAYAAREDMVPYPPEEPPRPPDALAQDTADTTIEEWVKEVFGKALSRVSKEEIEEAAVTLGGDLDKRKPKTTMAEDLRQIMER